MPIVRVVLAIVAVIAIGIAILRQPLLLPSRRMATARADASLLRAHVELLTKMPRHVENRAGLDAAAEYIAGGFRESGAEVREQTYGNGFRNVLARFGPRDGKLLVIGAHYDAFALNGRALPGADDNASGTAGLLELARLLGRNRPKVPVVLVAYSTEEPPYFGSELMGSAVHAERERNVGAMISLEMIGYYGSSQRYDSWVLDLVYPNDGEFIAVAGGWEDRRLLREVKRGLRAAGMRALSFTGPRSTLDASDQRNYWARGIPAVMVTDTAYLRNPHYHSERDTADRLDYGRMALVVDGVLEAVLASRPSLPV